MDVSLAIRQRLEELGLEQRELARAARVTESYVSQLLRRKKLPPDPRRSDIYQRMDKFLRLPGGELARLATVERASQLKREFGDESLPLFPAVRSLLVDKCAPGRLAQVEAILDQQPFGELERLVALTLLRVVKDEVGRERGNPAWLKRIAKRCKSTEADLEATATALLDAEIFDLSSANRVAVLDALIASWDVDLGSFAITVLLHQGGALRRQFALAEQDLVSEQPGFRQFLADPVLAADTTEGELAFLRRLPLRQRRPTPLFFYRVLQLLRDPIHFPAG